MRGAAQSKSPGHPCLAPFLAQPNCGGNGGTDDNLETTSLPQYGSEPVPGAAGPALHPHPPFGTQVRLPRPADAYSHPTGAASSHFPSLITLDRLGT